MESGGRRPRGRPRKRRREDEGINAKGGLESGKKRVVENNEVGGGARRPRGRPRKRRREDEGINAKGGLEAGKKRVVENNEVDGGGVRMPPTRTAYLGRYVLKEFQGNGVFLGKVVYYDTGLYRVEYEDGDSEDLEGDELREIVVGDDRVDGEFGKRRKRLDGLVRKNKLKRDELELKQEVEKGKDVEKVELWALNEVSGVGIDLDEDGRGNTDRDGDADSSGVSSNEVVEAEAEIPLPPPLELPPSSGTIGVPEECVLLLFSVYTFLRSFSIQLFLCPFGLDDFVGSLNCTVPNTLLDAVHVSLMRALRKHLESLSSDGLEVASKCLRCADWSLLDHLTWPVYLVQYLTISGYLRGPEWSGYSCSFLDRDYYELPTGRKLSVLQILCDDVAESSELRAEINMREELEGGMDVDSAEGNPYDDGPRRVHPKYSKTSACKSKEAVDITIRSHGLDPHAICVGGNTNVADVDENSDICRLCGMDGTLLCCDGCPWAYHSRCIGVLKMFLPEGPWYCPECTINKVEPPVTKGTSLSGAVFFGTDPYGQVFLGTCNHLLVYYASSNMGLHVRYYNYGDIKGVLHILYSSVQSRCFYAEICTEIQQYWEIPKSIFSPPEMSEISYLKEDVDFSSASFRCGSNKGIDANQADHYSAVNENSLDNMVTLCTDTCTKKTIQTNVFVQPSQVQDCLISGGKLPEQIKMESTLNTDSDSLRANQFDVAHQSLADKNCFMDSGHNNCSFSSQFGCTNLSAALSSQGKEMTAVGLGRDEKCLGDSLRYWGTSFKPQAYINSYMHGEFAASAAAKLAILSPDGSKISKPHASGSSKKAKSSILLQSKAFSQVASRFFWPSSEKKIVEVPRERCGWCHSCTAPPQSRRGCMLNSAALNAIRSATKILPGLRPVMDGGGSLPSIATYILYMEECLRGLVVGPFMSKRYRNQWRSRVEKATSYKALKVPLFELEENIRLIALSGDWNKLMDDWLADTSLTGSTTCPIGSVQTRGPGRRRQKKQSSAFEVTADSENKIFTWWYGGKLSKDIYQKVSLPRSTIKRMVHHAGRKRISGVSYADGGDIPRRSRRLVWRAVIDSSRNAAQLALQVRYLDHHVRWPDLLCPEQNFLDGKGQETEASIFRNAKICDKKELEDKILYGVVFGNQKHLPSCVMKNIIEIEKTQDEEKCWFSEMQIPLYLVKEFEEKLNEVPSPSKNTTSNLSVLQRRQLKASRKDVFTYLVCRRDKLDKCSCASCQSDVLLGKAVKCSECEGYCHVDCTRQSVFSSHDKVKISLICKQCCHTKPNMQCQQLNGNVYLTSPLHVQVKEQQNLTTVKHTKSKVCNQPVACVRSQESSNEKRAASCGLKLGSKSRSNTWGVVWKKKNKEDTGLNFRQKNILLKGNLTIPWEPVCALCQKPYNSGLTYIFCDACNNWFHAEAVELEDSRIPEVVGFKCCKCRRIRSPVCPYEDPESKRRRKNAFNLESNPTESDSGVLSESKEYEALTPVFPTEEVFVQDDPLLSFSRGELVTEQTSRMNADRDAGSRPGPQKLPVRRHTKSEIDNSSSSWNEVSYADPTVYVDNGGPLPSMNSMYSLQAEWNTVDGLDGPKKHPVRKPGNYLDTDGSSGKEVPNTDNFVLQNDIMSSQTERPSLTHAEWDTSNVLGDEVVFDYENYNFDDMVFEPQTYFSYTELLASDEGEQFGGADDSQCAENLEKMSSSIFSDRTPDQCGNEPLNPGDPVTDMVQCQMCSLTEPVPDLFCYLCGLCIHNYCSPWVQSSCLENGWICGNCQDSNS